jgi:DNA-binding transcriptional LysR family regulator
MPLPQPQPDLVSLDLLQSVADFGSIRQAALAHGITQPAASTRLRNLEANIGLDLLDRSSGRAQLTPNGRAIVEWSTRIIEDMRGLLEGAAALRSEAKGQLHVAASMTVAEYLVPQWLIRLRTTDRDMRVSLEMGNSEHVIDLVRDRRAELGFVEGHSTLAGLRSQVVLDDELLLVVEPLHAWAKGGRRVSAQELAETPLVLREMGSGTREVLERSLQRLGLAVTPAVELGSTTAIKAAVESGLGPAVLSRLAVSADVDAGRLIVVPIEGMDLSRSIRAVWLRSQPLSRRASRLLAQITAPRSAGNSNQRKAVRTTD